MGPPCRDVAIMGFVDTGSSLVLLMGSMAAHVPLDMDIAHQGGVWFRSQQFAAYLSIVH
jgi:hypothetical protein